MTFAGMSYWAVLIAAIVSYVFGSVYYMGLARPWMEAVGWSPEQKAAQMGGRKMDPVPFVVAFVAQLVMAWVLAGIIGHLGPGQVTLRNGLISGFFIWFGFVLTSLATNHGFGRQRPLLTVIDGAHWLGVLLLQGAVIGAWGVR